ncbi:MAG: ComEA family DNA-binding protein [Candidatus Omnitrophica bacterium]|nr:ComEA family DNA-binding protein [Candidatus Omnitrophota bacterium]MDD5429236.1 ComEA family DNA-binding protein [Candidatus Omnitrophota bacterium]
MFHLTHQERKVLLFIGFLIFLGSLIRFYNFHLALGNKPSGSEPVVISQPAKININEASLEGLSCIPGIGRVIAGRIIEYRLQHGNFQTGDDLIKVKGIGRKKIKIIEGYITF